MEPKIKTSDKISLAIMQSCYGSTDDILIPNFYFNGFYEMDVFKLSKSGYVTEYEIKISRSDFFADFKKSAKHKGLSEGKCQCNRFIFATPENLIELDEVPKYAGWVTVRDNGSVVVQKTAPMLNKNIFAGFETLARKLAFREDVHRRKVRLIEYITRQQDTKICNLTKQIEENVNKTNKL
jgi:hypothetical protein